MSQYDPYNAMPQGGQFGANMGAMAKGFEVRKAGGDMGAQMGGAAGIMGGIGGAAGGIMGGAMKIKSADRSTIQGRKETAQGSLDMAASVANAAGPIGMAVAAPLKLISMLLNIKGPRQKREEARKKQAARLDSKHSAMRQSAIAAATSGAGGMLRTGQQIPAQQTTVQDPAAATPVFHGRGTTG